ncbi:acyl-CoA thioesterase/bile acid-CoA:amino acid N-acyltransferase family protein [Actinomadura oligospora]|uniref:acyl-CoA thioesterase/bile acid-CoA:amino acid N-acyltransferase family protein n=1 Tax=Actinomadura oligospora TaxID=111804 RepID=UPI001B8050D0|nr:acyl-CoA thioesterase/bile acid-CoA:amino acid N-acyltransferase family protein [Actinomadura oligospora]
MDAQTGLADRAVHISVSGLRAGDRVSVTATASDYQRKSWRGEVTFRADAHGAVDLGRDRPTSGTYTGVDGMGLFWSMNPPSGDPDQQGFYAPEPSFQVTIGVTAHGKRLAQRTLTRQWLASGVTQKTFTLAADKVSGRLFLPPRGTPRHPAVLLIGGSEGGNTGLPEAALLASHGFPTLSVAYFAEPGLPQTLQNIPIEYFARAARLLAAQPGVDPAHLIVQGYSRGSEAALLVAQLYPGIVHGVIDYAPASTIHGGYPSGVAWTRGGEQIPLAPLAVDHINGPVLAVAGTQDKLWASEASAQQIMSELDDAHDRFPHRTLVYPGAGHGVGTFPYLAGGTKLRHPVTGLLSDLGGSRPANAVAKRQGWDQVLGFLSGLGR